MELYRSIIEDLKAWKRNSERKPLILKGARQTGKTWILEYFGRTEFKYTVKFNFDKDHSIHEIFETTKEPSRIISQLSLLTDSPILPGETLLIFDEIQECNPALNALKYFYEDASEYAVVAAGSLLGVALSKGDSFPVGKVEFLNLYPLTFKEFLKTINEKLYSYIEELTEIAPLPQFVTDRLSELYQQYLVIGGMPAVINYFLENKGMEKVKRKFLYKLVKPGARARDYEDALLWLESAGLIYRVFCTTKPFLPLKAYDDLSAFKVYLSDVGLLRELSGLPSEIIFLGNSAYTEFKGAIAENYVLQSLVPQYDILPRYWTSIGKAEVDFVIQSGSEIIPVEVKAQTRLGGKSLSVYDANYHPACKLRYSLNNLKQDGTLINIPLYLADWTKKIVNFLTLH